MLHLFAVLILILSVVPGYALDIHSMVVGDRIIELADNRRAVTVSDSKITGAWISPNAKYLAFSYETEEDQKLYCIRVSETKDSTLHMSQLIPHRQGLKAEAWSLAITPFSNTPLVSWSSDSDHIAFASYGTIKVGTPSGMNRASFDVSSSGDTVEKLIWSPDGRHLAALTIDHLTTHGNKPGRKVVVLNLSSGQAEVVYSQEGDPLLLEGWSSDAKSVVYANADNILARSKSAKHTFWSSPYYSLPYLVDDRSPDGNWWVAPGEKIRLTNDADGSTIDAIKEPASLVCWAPNSKMYAFTRKIAMADDRKLRVHHLRTLWLGTIGQYALNSMCISSDSDPFAEPTWSADSAHMAYVRDGSVYLARFSVRKPTMREKAYGGIPISDDEYKVLVLENAEEIGMAIQLYQCDWDDQLPPADQIVEKIQCYLEYPDVFFKPGTGENIFHYEPGLPNNQLDDPSTTVRAYLNAAPDWRIAIYADGHREIVPY